VPLTVLVPLLQ